MSSLKLVVIYEPSIPLLERANHPPQYMQLVLSIIVLKCVTRQVYLQMPTQQQVCEMVLPRGVPLATLAPVP